MQLVTAPLMHVSGHWGAFGTLYSGGTVVLADPAHALYIAPWVWHELTDFAPQTAVMVIASTLFDEGEYLRDYETFKREVTERFP